MAGMGRSHREGDIESAAASVEAVEQSRKLNPLALARATVHPGLQEALGRLDRCLAAERALLSVMATEESSPGGARDGQVASDLRRAFAVVLDDVASGLRSFAELIDAEYGLSNVERVDEVLHQTLEIVRETRAVLTELMLIDVDPREQTDLWMLQGSVLAAVEHVLRSWTSSTATAAPRHGSPGGRSRGSRRPGTRFAGPGNGNQVPEDWAYGCRHRHPNRTKPVS